MSGRISTLMGMLHDRFPAQVFGPEREGEARRIAGYLNGLEFSRTRAALAGGADETRRRAYDVGAEWFRATYWERSALLTPRDHDGSLS